MQKHILYLLLGFISFSLHSQTPHNIVQGDNAIHYKVFGEKGIPILIIKGGPGMNSEGFASLAQEVAKFGRAITYDQRGTGQSKILVVDSTSITLDLMLADIRAIRQDLGLESWVVLGHSFGGMLASYYAAKYPNEVDGLILSSSGGVDLDLFENLNIQSRLSPIESDSFNHWTNRISQGDTSSFARLKRATWLAPAYLENKTFVPVIAERLTQVNLAINGLVFQNMRRIGFDCKDALRGFTKPVLIIQGKQDILDKKLALKAESVFPNNKLVFVENCSHYGWLEQPAVYLDALKSHIGHISKEKNREINMKITDKKIVKSRVVKRPISEAWNQWTSHEGLKSFLCEDNKIELYSGGAFEIYFTADAPAGQKGSEGCKILAYLPEEMLSFNWNAPPQFPEVRNHDYKTWVVVQFFPHSQNETEVILTHLGWPEDPRWEPVYGYFDKAWEYVMGEFEKHGLKGE